jgi:hypothetical protein
MADKVNVYEVGGNTDLFDLDYLGAFPDTRLIHPNCTNLEFIEKDLDMSSLIASFILDFPHLISCMGLAKAIHSQTGIIEIDCGKALAATEALVGADSLVISKTLRRQCSEKPTIEESINEVNEIEGLIESLLSFSVNKVKPGLYSSESGIDVRFNFQGQLWLFQEYKKLNKPLYINLKNVVEATF